MVSYVLSWGIMETTGCQRTRFTVANHTHLLLHKSLTGSHRLWPSLFISNITSSDWLQVYTKLHHSLQVVGWSISYDNYRNLWDTGKNQFGKTSVRMIATHLTRNRQNDLQYIDDDPCEYLFHWDMIMINLKHWLLSSS